MSKILKNKIIRNTISCFSSSFVIILVNFLLMPFMISKLGVVQYGLIGMSAIFMMGGCISLLELGLQSSISKFVAEYNAKDNYTKISSVVCTSAALFLIIGLAMMTIGLLSSGFIAGSLLKVPQEYHRSFKIAILVIFSSYVFQFPNFALTGYLSGLQRFDVLKGIQIIATVLYASGVVFLLLSEHNYFSIIVYQVCVLFLQFCCHLVITLKQKNFSGFTPSTFSIESMGEVFKLTKYLFINRISGLFFYNSPRVLIGIFLGPAFMTSYEAVTKLSRVIKAALGFINAAIMPASSELHASQKLDVIRKLFLKTCRYQIFAVFPVVTCMMFLASNFYHLWLGYDFVKLAPLLWIALIWNLVAPFISTGDAIMVGMNKRLRTIATLGVTLTLSTIAITLIFVQKLQLTSVFIGPTLSTLIVLPFFLNMFFKELQVKATVFIKEFVISLLIGLCPLTLVFFINKLDINNSYLTLFVRGLVWCLSYWALLYIFMLDNEDRGLIKGLTRKFTRSEKNCSSNLNEALE